MSGEKPAPTAAEVAAARYWFSGADPLREPSMGPTTRVHVAVLRAALDAAEARAETAEERALDAFTLQPGCHDDAGKCPTWYDSCHCTSEALREVMTRAETAERERDEALDRAVPPGSFVVADTPETVERVRRAIIGDLRLPRLEDDHAAAAVLAALREAGR